MYLNVKSQLDIGRVSKPYHYGENRSKIGLFKKAKNICCF